MIALLGASAILLSGMQATITAPTSAFRTCLHDATTKATAEKVTADAIETYLRNACTAQLGTLREALIGFRMKNGMSRKAAASDAEMTIDDYVSTPADNYKFAAKQNAPKSPVPATAPATTAAALQPHPVATPASAPAPASTQPQRH